MSIAIRKTVSLPPEIALEAERQARAQGKTLSAVIQDALREARSRRLRKQLGGIQDYWSRQAREQGVLSEEDLDRILGS
jgi:hypothetical protein